MNTEINEPRHNGGRQTVTNHRALPAYVRGIPFWVWETALRPPSRAYPTTRI